MDKGGSPYRFYGRRAGKKMTPEKRHVLLHHLEKGGIPWWNPSESLDIWPDIQLEIGFGQGEHLIDQARRHPKTLFIGCEVFQDGVFHAFDTVMTSSITNIRIFPHDARTLMDQLPDQSLSRLYILFPDPWPKKKHWKRRMVHTSNLHRMRRLLIQGGVVDLATDHDAYAQAMRDTLTPAEGFQVIHQKYISPASKDEDQPLTRYEQKALAKQKKCYYFAYTYFRDSGSILGFQEP